MKMYWFKNNCNSSDFLHGKSYTIEEIKKITGIVDEHMLEYQVPLVFDEYDTNDTKEDELEVEIGILKKYHHTSLFATRSVLNPLYPEFSFQLYVGVGPNKREKTNQLNWLATLPLWLWTQIDACELAERDYHGDEMTTLIIQVKDGQKVWDIMEKMSVLEYTLK